MPELKECPFCGGKAELKTGTAYNSYPTARIVCGRCKAMTATYTDGKCDGSALFEAIGAWNMRSEKYETGTVGTSLP